MSGRLIFSSLDTLVDSLVTYTPLFLDSLHFGLITHLGLSKTTCLVSHHTVFRISIFNE